MSILQLIVNESTRKLSNRSSNQVFVVNDANVDTIRFSIPAGFSDIDIDENASFRAMYIPPGIDKTVYAKTLTFVQNDGVYISYDWQVGPNVLVESGILTVSFCILKTGSEVQEWHTIPYTIPVSNTIHTDDSDEGDESITPTVAQRVAVLESMIQRVASGAPVVVDSASDMTDTGKLYVLSTNGRWYYHNGSAWVAGGEYGAVATDTTLTQSRAPADAKAVGDKLTGLKSDLNNTSQDNRSTVKNLSKLFVYEQPSISVDSGLLPFPVKTNDSITIERIDGQLFQNSVQIRFYDENKNYITYISTIPYDKATRTVTFSYADAYYVGVTDVGSVAGTYRVINNNSKSLLFAEINERKAFDTLISNRVDILDSQAAKAKVINRFNKATITAGKYINPNTGNLNSSDGFFASDFIYIGDLDSVTVSYTHIFCWYDENKEWKGHPDNMNSGNADLTYAIPEDVVYLRFSAYNANLNSAQVGESVTRNNYDPFGVYNLPELRVSQSQIDTSSGSQIVVDASGGGDYTSFTQAIYDTVDDGTDVFVKPGTYDIVAEYVALFGQSAVDSMADADSSIFNGFQYGVRLRNRRVEFASGAHLVCDWTGHLVDGKHRFSALGVDYNVEIVGLDLDVTATFYCIHDDYGIATPYTVKYENCRVVGHNIYNANCIGGGCKKYSRHILNNCYFDNNLTGSATVRYHNTNADGAEPEIYVSNCYFNNWFTPRWYGLQTSKMRVYVNNCHARAIYKMAESSSYNVDNVELYKWNNEETDPIT